MAITDRLESLVRTALEMASLQGATLDARVLSEARSSLMSSGYSDWNGGTDFYTLVLELPVATYVEVESEQDNLESSIRNRIALQTRTESGEQVSEVVIAPLPVDAVAQATSISTEVVDESEPVPTFWQPGYFRLFISHVSESKVAAHALKEVLARYQIAAFVAHDDIEPSREWQSEIESALRTTDALAAIVVPNFVGSRWCDQEVGYALGRRKFVLALRAGADPHGFLGKYQGLQVNGLDTTQVAAQIFDVLIRHELTTQRMTESLVERMVRSMSWDGAKWTMTLLEKASNLNDGQCARLLRSIDDNIDVGDAFSVPDRIRTLIARVGESS